LPALNTIQTLFSLSIKDKIGRLADLGTLIAIDPMSRCIAVHTYQNILKVIPLFSASSDVKTWTSLQKAGKRTRTPTFGEAGPPFTLRFFDELNIHDICSLKSVGLPKIAVLYEDASGSRFVRVHSLKLEAQEFGEDPSKYSVSATSHKLFASNNGILNMPRCLLIV
jgi:hypothetical protein